MLQTILFGDDESEGDMKCKNIRQTGKQKFLVVKINIINQIMNTL